jgi:hypothetical protein
MEENLSKFIDKDSSTIIHDYLYGRCCACKEVINPVHCKGYFSIICLLCYNKDEIERERRTCSKCIKKYKLPFYKKSNRDFKCPYCLKLIK